MAIMKNGKQTKYDAESLLLRREQKEVHFPVYTPVKVTYRNPCNYCAQKDSTDKRILDYCHYKCKAV